jgi:hypothetical protein
MDAAAASILYLFQYISKPTDPIFDVLTPAYNRVLALSLLIAGAVIAFALMERILGGSKGAGVTVVGRTLSACAAAMVGLPVMRYAVTYSDLIATVWNADVYAGASHLVTGISPAFHSGAGRALGSTLGVFIAAFLTVLLAVLVHLELVLRAALLALTTTLLPLVCVMAIWPRLSRALTHMVGFILALLLSKFVVATAIYLGFAMVVHSYATSPDPSVALLTGLATLTAAVFAPLVLVQGIRFAESGAAAATRGFSFGAGRTITRVGTWGTRRLSGLQGVGRTGTSRTTQASVGGQPGPDEPGSRDGAS